MNHTLSFLPDTPLLQSQTCGGIFEPVMKQKSADIKPRKTIPKPKANTQRHVLITVKGIVQGVGFRPFVHRLAIRHRIAGSVRNTSGSVLIEAMAAPVDLSRFLDALKKVCPKSASIASITSTPLRTRLTANPFRIVPSLPSSETKLIPPDIRTCPRCFGEFMDPYDRRYHYPFINCTECGPRFTIIRDTPYDRKNTTMSGFKLCPACAREYRDIQNRRYHAEPNACPECGPKVWLTDRNGRVIETDNEAVFKRARCLLKDGKILAVKGIGGFHIAVDASNSSAVRLLKKRKRRTEKPFAVMADSPATIRKYAVLDRVTTRLLESAASPVLLLRNKSDNIISRISASGLSHTGWFLPYSPLHSLLFGPGLRTLVMTSANLSEEPIQHDNNQALESLKHIVDHFLLHDRPIHMPADDSVIKPFTKGNIFMRRSRGFAPSPISIPRADRDILATGGLQKNTLCLTKGSSAFLSQHIGDLENAASYDYFKRTIRHFIDFYRLEPEAVACDLHPDYLSTRYAQEFALRRRIPLVKVQHHHAHMLSVMAEHGITRRCIGVILDGTGYGTDGNIWGGEFLVGDASGYSRAGHLRYLRLPGGDLASRETFRSAISLLSESIGKRDLRRRYGAKTVDTVLTALKSGINTPYSSSAGRIFDAAASVLGLCQISSYDAEAPMRLESAATGLAPRRAYPWTIERTDGLRILDFRPTFFELWRRRNEASASADFHWTFASALTDMIAGIAKETRLKDVVLSGGVFQNAILLEALVKKLQKGKFRVFIHGRVPANDGGLALGQAFFAAHRS
jgi:hydrogenase maturation protein HypF